MNIIVENEIKISNYAYAEANEIKRWLTIENPQYYQNEKMGFSNWNTPKELKLYREDNNLLYVPVGILEKLFKHFSIFIINYEDRRIKEHKRVFNSSIDLYDYQEKVVNDVLEKELSGIIVMPAGSGKTQTAIELIARLGLRALWITHTIDLLNQSYSRAKDNLINAHLGKVTAGKCDLGDDITFATVQTLRNQDLELLKNQFDVIIVDECHRVTGSITQVGMFYEVINHLNARYKIGLTATPYRSMKGTEIAMFSLLGDILVEVDKKVVKTCKAKIEKLGYYGFDIPKNCYKDDGNLNYTKLLNKLSEDEARNLFIAEKVKDSIKDNRSILVLSDRLEQLEYIKNLVGKGSMIHGKMTSKKGKAEREAIIQAMRDGKEKILYASYGLAKEGLDIPCLDTLILATPKKDKATVIQSVGRIERVYDGKKEPVVCDVVDSEGIFQTMWYARNRIYKSNGNL